MKNIPKFIGIVFLLLTLVCGLCTISYAVIPHLINYQGRLTDSTGRPLEGAYNLTFRIYDVLDLPQEEWSLQKNYQWLDQAVARGDDIYLATDPVQHYIDYPDSVYPKEIDYLEKMHGLRQKDGYMVHDGE